MKFLEALAEMKQGKKARRHGFKDYYFINPENGEFTIHLVRYDKKAKTTSEKNITYGQLGLLVNNIEKDDWEIIEEKPAQEPAKEEPSELVSEPAKEEDASHQA